MPTIDDIKAKKPEDRTPDEAAQLAAAERTTDPLANLPWDKIFDHPRFKELVTAKNNAEQEALRLKNEKAQADADALAKQGEWKTLAEQRAQEIEKLKGQAGQLTAYEQTLQDTLKAQIAELPEALRGLVPAEMTTPQQLAWLSKNKPLLMKPAAGDIGAGARGGGKPEQKTELTPEQKAIAKSFGYSDDEYAHFLGNPMEPFKQSKQGE